MPGYTLSTEDPLKSLRTRGLILLVLSAIVLVLTYRLLAHFWGGAEALRWLLLSSGVMLFLAWTFWRNLSRNYRDGESRLLPRLGAGNTLTFLRGLLVAATAGFLFSPTPQGWLVWLPGIFYTLASLGDFIDGYLARRQGHATRLGEVMDMYVDGIGVLAGALLLVQYGRVPVWYLLVGLARYLFLAGIWLRDRMGLQVHDLPHSDTRRALAAVQMIFSFLLLLPLFSPPATRVAAAAFALPFLANFLLDWLRVSGVLSPGYSPPDRLQKILLSWLPPFLRLSVFILTIAVVWGRLMEFPALVSRFPTPGFFTYLIFILELVMAFMVLLGFAGRGSSLGALVLIGLGSNFLPLTALDSVRILLFTTLLHLGTGYGSLWNPEERLIGLRAGQADSRLVQVLQESHLNSNSSIREAS